MTAITPFNRRSFLNSGFGDIYSMLDDFFSDGLASNRGSGSFRLDVRETGGEYVIDADLPGVNKEEVSLDVEDDLLRISVNREETAEHGDKGYIHRERRVSSMSRGVRLGGADSEGIRARLENGVLTVTVPKKGPMDGRRKIEIDG